MTNETQDEATPAAQAQAFMAEVAAEQLAEEPKPKPPEKPKEPGWHLVTTEQITRNDAANSRKRGFRERHCIVLYTAYLPKRLYANGMGGGVDREKAMVYPVAVAIQNFGESTIFELLDEEIYKSGPRFDMEKMLKPEVIRMIKLSPGNPMVHGLIMANFGRKPPASINEYNVLKDWVENNCDDPSAKLTAKKTADTPVIPNGITLRVKSVQNEHGRATYTVRREALTRVEWTAQELQELIDEGLSYDELVARLDSGSAEHVDSIEDTEGLNWDYGRYDYDNHEGTDIDGVDRYTEDVIPSVLRPFLIATQSGDTLRRLGLT